MQTLFKWYGRKVVIGTLIAVAILIVAGVFFKTQTDEVLTEAEEVLPTVQVSSVGALVSESSLSLIGTVEAVSQATVQSEASGRVVAVNAKLGDSVSAGSILVQLENAAQRATVLQAEGSYESALAASAQSDVGVSGSETNLRAARNTALTTYRNTYTTGNDVVVTIIDDVFTDPTSRFPGLRIDGAGFTISLNNRRVALQTELTSWRQTVNTLSTANDFAAIQTTSEQNINTILSIIDDLISATLDEDNKTKTVAGGSIDAYRSRLSTARATLNGTLSALQTAETNVRSAEEALAQAKIAGSNSSVSNADAQIKQALGSLRSAEAALSKTIIRAPIAGEVNSMDIKVGDFVGQQTIVAEIANNNALEVTTFVGENDRNALKIGQTVVLDGQYPGLITKIANAINPTTLKTEVVIATESDTLNNGDTVRIEISGIEKAANTTILIPISAVKFTDIAGSVFFVTEGVLESKPVELGRITGTSVEITSGLDLGDTIVIDARGLVIGQKVEAIKQQ